MSQLTADFALAFHDVNRFERKVRRMFDANALSDLKIDLEREQKDILETKSKLIHLIDDIYALKSNYNSTADFYADTDSITKRITDTDEDFVIRSETLSQKKSILDQQQKRLLTLDSFSLQLYP